MKKFRFWDSKNQIMIYDITLKNAQEKLRYSNSSFSQYDPCYEWREGIEMEFIGLKDSQEQDVYEGDILYCQGGNEHQGYREFSQVGFVEFCSGAFMFTYYDARNEKVYCDFGHLDKQDVELWGNIYQNADRLK